MVIAIGLAAMTLFLGIKCLRTGGARHFQLVIVFYCAQLGIFILAFADSAVLLGPRLVPVGVALSHFAIILCALLLATRIVAPINGVLLSLSIALGIFLGETMLQLRALSAPGKMNGPEWVGVMEPHPSLDAVYRPYSVLKTYYPDNPRDYFQEEDSRRIKWWLRVAAGNVADLRFPVNDPDKVQIDITKAESKSSSDIQLNLPRLRVKSQHSYRVMFQARAGKPRKISLGVASAHEPWNGLGLYKTIRVTSQEQSFEADFVATASDDNARIHFDIGGSDIGLDVSSVELLSLPDGARVEPNLPPRRYFVSYSFNGLGCRGPDYRMPKPTGTFRILLLGDSYTLGVGVHEKDTFARQLEHLLNDDAEASSSGRNYEVINCGVSGYGTQEERIFYELFGGKYTPDLVLLVMAWNDDMSFFDEVKNGYVNREPGKLEKLFYTWATVQDILHRRPSPDFLKSSQEVRELGRKVRGNGGRFGVIMFRTDSSEIWKHVTMRVTEALQGTGVPIVDLGPMFLKHSAEDLLVHAVDAHPNHIAHRIVARELSSFVKEKTFWGRDEE